MHVFKFLLIFYGLNSVLAQTYNGHKSINTVQPNEENVTEQTDHSTRLENELTRTNQLLNSLYTEYASSQELLHSLSKDYVLTKQNLAALTIQHIDTEKRLSALEDDHSSTKQILKRTKTELDNTTEELVKVKRALEHEKERYRQSRIIPPTETAVVTSQSAVSGVAFFATMNAHPEHLGIHQIVEFPTTITNEGNAWDSRTSTFKAPRAGLYYFSASIMSHLGD
ncbi:unnamed protein product [Mytilus coruscus]|uniref:C1q domain-containing protein n=1 Tax=Mytilus coruscus TaxID=42192 RepID=A0A6J8A7U1_MYTCO|nr:unnamed protein product [Mytilus coruscus]